MAVFFGGFEPLDSPYRLSDVYRHQSLNAKLTGRNTGI